MKIRDVKDKSCDNERKDGINLKDKEKWDRADIPDMIYRRRVNSQGDLSTPELFHHFNLTREEDLEEYENFVDFHKIPEII